jgi:hypothetical protein
VEKILVLPEACKTHTEEELKGFPIIVTAEEICP